MTDERKEGGLALFDMDGTLLPWDTQYVFSCFVVQRHPWRRLLLLFYLACLPLFFLGIWDEEGLPLLFVEAAPGNGSSIRTGIRGAGGCMGLSRIA